MQIPWLAAPETALPSPDAAWGADAPVPGLLAAGGELSVTRLLEAYSSAIFPWFSDNQPILWWSPDPRMVLSVAEFKLHRSLRKTLAHFRISPRCEVRIDHDFARVIRACATAPRTGQSGTWIVEDMVQAYIALHQAGHAHSVETWIDGELVGGLYCVAIGHAVFGESMFAQRSDASKIALAALVAFCRANDVRMIDCQQNTPHLARMGAHEIARSQFVAHVAQARLQAAPAWHFDPVYWTLLLPPGDGG